MISLLGAYHPEEIYSKYIIRVAGKGFTVVDYPSKVYGFPDTYEYIDGNLPFRLILDIDTRQYSDPMNPELPSLDEYKFSHEDLLSRILIACTDIINSDLNHFIILDAFALASSSNANKCSWHIVYPYARFIDYKDLEGFVKKVADRVGKSYSVFIDFDLYKSRFSLHLLRSAKEDRVKRPAISSIKIGYCKLENYLVQPKSNYSEIWPRIFSSEKPEKEEFQPIENKTALSVGAGLVITKYGWLEVGDIRKGFINFQARSLEACPICNIKYEKDQLYGLLRSNGYFVLKYYRQKNYKPDHKELAFGKVTEVSAKPKRGIVERIGDAILNPRLLVGLLVMMINVEKLKDAPEVYPDFLGIEKTTTLIRSPPGTWKTTALREIIMALKDKDIIIVQVESHFCIEFTARSFVAILDEANAIMRQMSSGTNARESENAMCDVLRSARHVLAMDAFANTSTLFFLQAYRSENIHVVDNKYQPRIGETVEFIYDLNSGAEAMRIGYDLLRQGKRVAFVSTRAVIARALVEKASKLSKPDNSPVKAHAYYGDMDGKQRQRDFSDINVAWGELDCVAYTNTVEAGISFEVTGHFNIIIAITNIATPVHVEALAQMLYRIRDCPRRIVSLFYQKNSNELFHPPGRENIRAELASIRPNNLPTAIKGYCEWNNNTISYKVDKSPAIITFIEVEHQKRLSARYFIEKLCSLIASTSASLQLIKIDESREVIRNRKSVHNEIRVEALVIKNTDFNTVATSRNLSPEEAEVLKFDQECYSIADTMALKRFYMRNLYCKDMSIEDWNNICNRKFIENFSSPEAQKHFLRLSYFRRQGHDEENAMKGLKAEENIQWEIACHRAEENLEKSVAEDLRKSYSANHWKVIQELFQILGFTGIDDKHILSGSMVSEAFAQSCERFIEIQNQSLSLFGFKSHDKTTPDLNSDIKAINAIAGNWCGYTIKSDKKRIGPKGQQVWQYSYRINHQPYNSTGFRDKGAPELPPYRLKTDNNIQELFDSIGQEK
ncbi:uncharacterized protein OCT59_015440 [Rhizophagus irregularis]|uniref:uncharacterized protein n=1 Tax=Rhizophagus irregularis TaxID=588596 RepID=UPI00332EA199|nr:hypothetical protein OCT59_015440 [Rhizophagus irregularis]